MPPLVVLPHADFTQRPSSSPDHPLLDVAASFVQRVTSRSELDASVAGLALELPTGGPDAMTRYLQLQAGADLLASPHAQVRLRAVGAVLAAISGPPSPVRLRLDDLELEEGSTERMMDALSAGLSDGVPYRPDVMAAVEQCVAAGGVRIRLTQDQQLPALFLFATFLNGRIPIELEGDFALRHREALANFEPLREARVVMEFAPAPMTLQRKDDLAEGTPIAWRDGGRLTAGQLFGGEVTLEELLAPDTLRARGCRVAVVPFAAVTDRFIGARGGTADVEEVRAAVRWLTEAGVSVVGEWWVGAPGIGAEALERTATSLEGGFLPWVAGLRQFHWTRGRSPNTFAGAPVDVQPPEADRDLARTHPFSAASTLEKAALPELFSRLAHRLSARRALVPGRIAEAYASPPAPPPARGERIALDPCCAVVPAGAARTEPGKPTHYAVNLRTGALLGLDPRIAPALATLRTPALPGEVLSGFPAEKIAPLLKALVQKGVLVER